MKKGIKAEYIGATICTESENVVLIETLTVAQMEIVKVHFPDAISDTDADKKNEPPAALPAPKTP